MSHTHKQSKPIPSEKFLFGRQQDRTCISTPHFQYAATAEPWRRLNSGSRKYCVYSVDSRWRKHCDKSILFLHCLYFIIFYLFIFINDNLQRTVRGGSNATHSVLAGQATQCSSGKSGLTREIFNRQCHPWSLASPSLHPPRNISPTTRTSPDGASAICIWRWVRHSVLKRVI